MTHQSLTATQHFLQLVRRRLPVRSSMTVGVAELISQTPCEHRGPSRPWQRALDRRNRECVAERDFLQSVEAPGRAGVPGVEIDP